MPKVRAIVAVKWCRSDGGWCRGSIVPKALDANDRAKGSNRVVKYVPVGYEIPYAHKLDSTTNTHAADAPKGSWVLLKRRQRAAAAAAAAAAAVVVGEDGGEVAAEGGEQRHIELRNPQVFLTDQAWADA